MSPKKKNSRLAKVRLLSIVIMLAAIVLVGSIVFSQVTDPSAQASEGEELALAAPEKGEAEQTDLPAPATEEASSATDPAEEAAPAREEDAAAEESAAERDVPPAEEPAGETEQTPAADPAEPEATEAAEELETAEAQEDPEEAETTDENEPQPPAVRNDPPSRNEEQEHQEEEAPADPLAAEREALLPAHVSTGRFANGMGEAVSYSWGENVPETKVPVLDEWFSDAAFIGNSLCDGLMLYGNLKGTTFYSAKSITVNSIYSEKPINHNGTYISITDALSLKQYKKIFVMLGVNELILGPSTFRDSYAALIDYLRGIEPGAEIYLQTILPVTEEKSNSDRYITKDNILAFNDSIRQLAADKQVYYLDIYDALADENGYLPAEEAFDGVHLLRNYYQKWCDYLRSHSISEVSE